MKIAVEAEKYMPEARCRIGIGYCAWELGGEQLNIECS